MPTKSSNESEHKVLIGLLYALAFISVPYMGWVWINKTQDCQNHCVAEGLGYGQLCFKGGGRLNLGTYSDCIDTQNAKVSVRDPTLAAMKLNKRWLNKNNAEFVGFIFALTS